MFAFIYLINANIKVNFWIYGNIAFLKILLKLIFFVKGFLIQKDFQILGLYDHSQSYCEVR